MIIETIERLLNSAYYINQKTGVVASSIQCLRSGERQLKCRKTISISIRE
ncbi:XRE family transcriptional regulator [Staphylococcus epidermidis]|nr:XRE family transcriptional regulator [Staphylococcus epidermidis]RIL61384.1 XRE family transcriptional regulator [Staphylococcus epidermidis]RIL61708.1 XRE family transcriptional regulator [Staphylococcus epidermidis]